MTLLVTPTLLDAFEFVKSAPPLWAERAYISFVNKIQRKYDTPMPKWVERGIDFENAVQRVCENAVTFEDIDQGSELFREVAATCFGGEFQKRIKRYETIDGQEFLYFCKMDNVHGTDFIIDIKTTKNFKGPGKYLRGWQHRMYCWALPCKSFQYLIAEWVSEDSDAILDLHRVNYEIERPEALTTDIIDVTKEMLSFIEQRGLYNDYYTIFSNNRKTRF